MHLTSLFKLLLRPLAGASRSPTISSGEEGTGEEAEGKGENGEGNEEKEGKEEEAGVKGEEVVRQLLEVIGAWTCTEPFGGKPRLVRLRGEEEACLVCRLEQGASQVGTQKCLNTLPSSSS